jgi:lysophospholipase L1-like esterase
MTGASQAIGELVRGVAFAPRPRLPYPRLSAEAERNVLATTRLASLVPAGLHLALRTDGVGVRARATYRVQRDPLYAWAEPALTLWHGNEQIATAPVRPGRTATELEVPPQAQGARLALHFPAHLCPEVEGVDAVEGELEPACGLPRWIAYGDSITAGWSAPAPGSDWVSRTARGLELDAVNLGFAGAAHGDAAVAQDVAALPAELVTIAFGTNCWTRRPHTPDQLAVALRRFVTTVRGTQPDTPIVVISPLLRPEAEEVRNSVGATHAELRARIEATTEALLDEGMARLSLIPGRDLIGPKDLVDGLHPGAAGHERLAFQLTVALRTALETA